MLQKILLVIIFSALVLGKDYVIIDEKDLPKHNPDIAYIFRSKGMDEEGILLNLDECNIVEDYSYFDLKSQTPADTFMAISEANITGLKVGKDKTPEEIAEINKCRDVGFSLPQDLIAYAANFIEQIDILPSQTYQMSNGPKFQWEKIEIDGVLYKYKRTLNGNCYFNEQFWDSVYHSGVVDESCIPEDFASIPGYDWDESGSKPQGSPDKIEEKCVEEGDEFDPQLKGYGIGSIYDGNITTMKEAITKYGPVYVDQAHQVKEDISQPDGFIHYYNRQVNDRIFIGWDETGFIAIVIDYQNQRKVKEEVPFTGTFTQWEYDQQLGQNVQVEKEYDNIFINSASFFTSTEELIIKQDQVQWEQIPEIDEADLPVVGPDIHNPDIVTIFKAEYYDDSEVELDIDSCVTQDTFEVDLTDVEPAETFLAIPEDIILELKASRELTKEEIIEQKKCSKIEGNRYIAQIFAYQAYTVDQSDIFPSLRLWFSNGPKYQWREAEIDGTDYKYKEAKNYNCHNDDWENKYWSTIFKYGLVDESCIPNDFSQIPGYGWKDGDEYPNGTAPKLPDECVNSEVQFDPKLKGYGIGSMQYGNTTTFKKAITKYGPLYVEYGYYQKKYNYDQYYAVGYFYRKTFIGWDEEGFITIEDDEQYDPETYELISIKKKIGKIPFVGEVNSQPYDLLYDIYAYFVAPTELNLPLDCNDLSGKPKGHCPCIEEDTRGSCKLCTGEDTDDSECICSKDPEELINVKIEQCKCLLEGDLRGQCYNCSQEFHPDGCICPSDPLELVGIPDTQCNCSEEQDPRGQCYTCSSKYYPEGCICPKTADELKGIPKESCDCLPTGDLRVQCEPVKCTDQLIKPTEGCICTYEFHPDRCFCPTEPIDLEGISSIQCGCLQSDDQRKECQPPEIGEDPSIDFGEINPAEQTEIEEIKEESRNEDNSVENIISETIKGENSIGITLPQNEVYEEENTIEVQQNQKLVLEAKIDSENQQIPVIRPSEKITDETQSFISVSGNGDVEIRSFIIEHFTQETQSPLLKTENEGVLRLVDVILSSDKRVKDENDEEIKIQTEAGEKLTPFIEAHGKLVVLTDVVFEPSKFNNCNAILLVGTNGATNHQLISQGSTFQVRSGGKSFLDSNQFTTIFKNSAFNGVKATLKMKNQSIKDKRNSVQQETCEWSTASVNIVDGVGYFESTTFKDLIDGAVKVGSDGIVTLKDSVLLYGNNLLDSKLGRNIICAGSVAQNAQLRAESSSFIDVGTDGNPGAISLNKWILADKDTCQITGSVGDGKTLLFTPQIQSVKATGNEKKTGIDIEISGNSLFKCGKLYLQVSLKPKPDSNEDVVTTKQYKLEEHATVWDNDTSVSASIGEDDLVKKGNKLVVSVLVQADDNTRLDAEIVAGGSNTAEIEGFEVEDESEVDKELPVIDQPKGGLSTGALIGIIIAAVAVVVIIIIVIICCVYCQKKTTQSNDSGLQDKKKRAKYHDTTAVPMDENRW